ncbi:MAG: response regulator transcription factor, partial [Saprospiraceae bacterium]|nr:response regulator transcription factor [Saprospiraceae bacterium]
PEVDGFELAEAIRKRDLDVPILFLTAKSLKEDRLHGFELGGDDYIVKPFSIQELLYKIEVFLRRRKVFGMDHRQRFQIGDLDFDYANLLLIHDSHTRKLTQREADLLRYLCQSKNKLVKRSRILELIWGEDDYFMGRSLDVFISRLRKYLSADGRVEIENVHGVGFKLKVSDV